MKNLTVKDLMEMLSKMNPDAEVVSLAEDYFENVAANCVYEDNGKCYIFAS